MRNLTSINMIWYVYIQNPQWIAHIYSMAHILKPKSHKKGKQNKNRAQQPAASSFPRSNLSLSTLSLNIMYINPIAMYICYHRLEDKKHAELFYSNEITALGRWCSTECIMYIRNTEYGWNWNENWEGAFIHIHVYYSIHAQSYPSFNLQLKENSKHA